MERRRSLRAIFAAPVITAVVFAGCAGSSTGPAVAPTASGTQTQRGTIATATLTLKFPPNYHVAANAARKPAGARGAAYVNPTANNLVWIYTGTAAAAPSSPSLTATVAASADGTQTISGVPLYAATSEVAAVELDPTQATILAPGETSVSVTPGTVTPLTLTMQMNAVGFALSEQADGSNAVRMSGQSYGMSLAGTSTPVYIYPIDALGGYTSAAPAVGVGGLPSNPTVTASASDASSHFTAALLGNYAVKFGTATSTVTVSASAPNPAYSAFFSNPILEGLIAAGTIPYVTVTSFINASGSVALTPQITGHFTEFTIPTAASAPQGIAVGPDGALWFAEGSGNNIGRVTTTGSFTEFAVPTSSAVPLFIVTGADGLLYFTEGAAHKVASMTTSGTFVETGIPYAPVGITKGPDNNIWFSEGTATDIGKYASPSPAQFPVPYAAMGLIASGPDGNLWYTASADNAIVRVSTTGSATSFTVPTVSAYPNGITAGPDGNLWFTETTANAIGKITTAGAVTEYSLGGNACCPGNIAAGSDGALWFTSNANYLGRITTSGTIATFTAPTSGSSPLGITAGPDGALWFTEYSGNKIGRLH